MAFHPDSQIIQRAFRSSSRYWPILLIQSGALAYLAAVLILTNSYGFFAYRKLILAVALIPLFYALTAFISGQLLISRLAGISRRAWIGLLAIGLLLAVSCFALFPAPQPGLAQPHHLRILVAPDRNPASKGGVIEIQRIRTLDGRQVDPTQFKLDSGWQIVDTSLFSPGKPGGAIELRADMVGGVSLGFKYQPDAGSVTIFWDGERSDYDLYAPAASVSDVVLRSVGTAAAPLSQHLASFGASLLYFLGLFAAAWWASLALRFNLLKPSWLFVSLAYAVILALFLFLKLDYPTFTAERVFRDTTSYLAQADIPLTSLSFWAGERSFTLPLLYKILNLHSNSILMSRVFQFQLWFSIICWLTLAITAARGMRNRWIGLAAFAVVLLFGTNLETGLWDSLLLTESLSISLFALLLGFWLDWFSIPRSPRTGAIKVLNLAGMLLVSILYAFTRDSNLYFLLICAAVFILALIVRKIGRAAWFYVAAVAVLAVLNTASLSGGNRWQIFIYDHLAIRILPDPAATEFFANAGLPVSPELRQITAMVGYEYHDLLINSPAMQPVRDWINLKGKTVYLQYLLSRPIQTLLEPIQQFNRLANGSNQVYLYPRFLPLSIPERVTWITSLFYSHSTWMLVGLFLLAAAASWLYWTGPLSRSPLALVIFALLISIYPMMFIIWHGEPLEIERHAVQIGIQLRLAGWLALPLLMDAVLQWQAFRRWFDLPGPASQSSG